MAGLVDAWFIAAKTHQMQQQSKPTKTLEEKLEELLDKKTSFEDYSQTLKVMTLEDYK